MNKKNNELEAYEALQERARTYDDVQRIRIALSHRKMQKGHLAVGYDAPEQLKQVEAEIKKDMKRYLKGVDLWEGFLKNICGVGEGLASTIIGELTCRRILKKRCKKCKDKENIKSFCKECEWETIQRGPEDFPSTSHFYSYTGFGNNPDGTIHKRVKGKPANWNNFLKMTFWKFAQNQIKQGKTYRKYYDERKEYELKKLDKKSRLLLSKSASDLNHKSMGRMSKSIESRDKKSITMLSESKEKMTKGHIHNRACRYMIKRFLADLFHYWSGDFKGKLPE